MRRSLSVSGCVGRALDGKKLTRKIDGAEPVFDTYLAVKAPDMPTDGIPRDVKGFGDGPIRFPLRDHPENFALTRCQRGMRGLLE
jgi:hypothetical protein